jgi:hypothetical protein
MGARAGGRAGAEGAGDVARTSTRPMVTLIEGAACSRFSSLAGCAGWKKRSEGRTGDRTWMRRT